MVLRGADISWQGHERLNASRDPLRAQLDRDLSDFVDFESARAHLRAEPSDCHTTNFRDTGSWRPQVSPGGFVGLYHQWFAGTMSEETGGTVEKRLKLFISCSSYASKACLEFYNLVTDLPAGVTAGYLPQPHSPALPLGLWCVTTVSLTDGVLARTVCESKEAWWLKHVNRRNRLRIVHEVAHRMGIPVESCIDPHSYDPANELLAREATGCVSHSIEFGPDAHTVEVRARGKKHRYLGAVCTFPTPHLVMACAPLVQVYNECVNGAKMRNGFPVLMAPFEVPCRDSRCLFSVGVQGPTPAFVVQGVWVFPGRHDDTHMDNMFGGSLGGESVCPMPSLLRACPVHAPPPDAPG